MKSITEIREAMKEYGKSAQTDTQLLTLIIGNEEEARRVLDYVNYSLPQLRRLSLQEIACIKGIGQAKAAKIAAALELSKRGRIPEKPKKITCSEDVYHLMNKHLEGLPHEEFWLILMNRANRVIGKVQISIGGTSSTIADPKIIFKQALNSRAIAVILVHNHPSGNKQPSHADISLTKKLKNGGELLEISVLDHVIYTDEYGHFSFNDEGMI